MISEANLCWSDAFCSSNVMYKVIIHKQHHVRSQQTWGAAAQAGHFADEIGPVVLKSKKGEVEMTLDEHPKPKTTIEQLAKLPTVFKKGGVVTAGSGGNQVEELEYYL